MLKKAQKIIGLEHSKYHTLRYVLKVGGDRMNEFVAKNQEVKVQTSRDKSVSTQYSVAQGEEGNCNKMFMGADNLSRR